MRRPKSLVLFGNGINCEMETTFAERKVGFKVDLIHINEFSKRPEICYKYDMVTLPGGFLDGDDIGAAKAQAIRWKYERVGEKRRRVIEILLDFVENGGLILGICNGFQLLVKTGLLPAFKGFEGVQLVSLTFNDSGRFEDRWVSLRVNPQSKCIFTKGIEEMYLPCRHGEGKFIAEEKVLKTLFEKDQVVLQYVDESGEVTERYPFNPNGSLFGIAGISDETGRIFGLMPHPEASVDFTQHPRWTRGIKREDGIRIFLNAYEYARDSK